MRTLRGAAVALAVVAVGLAGTAWFLRGQDYGFDFRGPAVPAAVRFAGPQVGRFVKQDGEGLAIRLPKDRRNRAQVGFSIPLQISGDFEVTATFQLLHADTPATGYGVGVLLGVDDRARVGRLARPDSEQVVLWDSWPVVDGVRRMEGAAVPCVGAEGRLRLKRTGRLLSFCWSPSSSGEDFQEVHAADYGLEDTEFFTFVVESSGQPCAVEARVLELQIRAVSELAGTLLWWAAGLSATALLVAGGVLGLGRVGAKPAGPRAAAAAEPARANGVQPTAPTVEAATRHCPQCRQRVKVPPHALGKRVKCPRCHAAFAAPQA